jgi:hypothetical protein
MLGKVIVVAGAGAAYLLRTRAGREQYARLREAARALPVPGRRAPGTAPVLVDRRPQAIENRTAAPVLLPDAAPVEIARAVSEEQSRSQ